MGITFSGIASGLPVDDIVNRLLAVESQPLNLLQQRKTSISSKLSQFTTLSSKTNSLKFALQKFTDSTFGGSLDIFEGKTATSADTTKFGATVTNDAVSGNYSIDVLQLATATKAASTVAVGQATTATSNLDDIAESAITSGNFTLYVNNQAQTISVDKNADTIGDVLGRIEVAMQSVVGVGNATATVDTNGKIQISTVAGTTLQFGAASDTSNFAKITHLNTGSFNLAGTDYTAKYATNIFDKDGTIVGNAARFENDGTLGPITAGTFTIGGAEFTIDNTTTFKDLIADINASTDAGVQISYDASGNKVNVISKKTGNQAIVFDDNGTNFLEVLGLTNGNDTLSSQTLGNNAKIKIDNGAELESTSNAVDSTVTGLAGVTLNLLNQTTSSVSLSITQNTDSIKSNVSDLLAKFNDLISTIDSQTKKDALLNGESSLVRFRSSLRSQMSGFADSGLNLTEYDSLGMIGISTGAASSTVNGAPSSTFTLNESKFLAALQENPSEVRKLLIGDGSNEGVLTKLKEMVDGALDPEFGLFAARTEAANSQIKSINDAIKRGQERLEKSEARYRAQFTAMEKAISQLQQQQTSLARIIPVNNNNN